MKKEKVDLMFAGLNSFSAIVGAIVAVLAFIYAMTAVVVSSAPLNLTGEIKGESITLKWDKPKKWSTAVKEYQILLRLPKDKKQPPGKFKVWDTVDNNRTNYEDVQVAWGDGDRVYRVVAVALSGKTSARSNFRLCKKGKNVCTYKEPNQGGR